MGGPSYKPEFPPLLPPGFHFMTIEQVRALCVDGFNSISRNGIMSAVEKIIEALNAAGVVGELWLDGSFSTEKINPEDVDALLHVQSDLYRNNPTVRAAINWATSDDRYASHSFDAYPWIEYVQGSPMYSASEEDRIYWTNWFGHNRDKRAKGIIIIKLPAVIP